MFLLHLVQESIYFSELYIIENVRISPLWRFFSGHYTNDLPSYLILALMCVCCAIPVCGVRKFYFSLIWIQHMCSSGAWQFRHCILWTALSKGFYFPSFANGMLGRWWLLILTFLKQLQESTTSGFQWVSHILKKKTLFVKKKSSYKHDFLEEN